MRVSCPRRDRHDPGLPARGTGRRARPLRRGNRCHGDEPPGLAIRTGGATGPASLTATWRSRSSGSATATRERPAALGNGERRRSYRETRLEPGDPVTIVGRALPFSDLSDPVAADYGTEADLLDDDPEIAADLAAARASGTLAADAEDAWGNAAIPGFGIGRPVVAARIDPGAHPLPLATPAEAALARSTFEIEPEALVLASSAEVPLLIAYGTPGAVMQRSQLRFTVGLLGAVPIASAMVLAVMLSGGTTP
jgi:hypothetical protein